MAVVIGVNQGAEVGRDRGLGEARRAGEAELVSAVRAGSDRAFEELYSRYRGQIRAFVLGMLRDPARADDVTQEVFLSALRRLRSTESQILLRPWLFEIARNASIDEIRRRRRQLGEIPLEADGRDLAVGVPALASVETAMEDKQRLRDLRGAFGGLSQSHHRVIVLRELEGLSYEQIGERLGVPRTVVESTLFRARRRLGAEYRELASGRRCAQVQALIESGSESSLLSLGIRQRRQLSRHLAHCQQCRRVGRLAGIDDSFFRSRLAKIAVLLPLPWLHLRRSSPSVLGRAGQRAGAVVRSAQTLAPVADPSGPWALLSRTAAAGAAVLIAVVGGGFGSGGHPPALRPGAVSGSPSHGAPAGQTRRSAAALVSGSSAMTGGFRPRGSATRVLGLTLQHGGSGAAITIVPARGSGIQPRAMAGGSLPGQPSGPAGQSSEPSGSSAPLPARRVESLPAAAGVAAPSASAVTGALAPFAPTGVLHRVVSAPPRLPQGDQPSASGISAVPAAAVGSAQPSSQP